MILLSFSARNHKSFRDEAVLDLVSPKLVTLQPKDGDWASVVYPLAGVFGGNATGKSALLDALLYAFRAIRHSASSWQSSRTMHRAPFRLDGTHETASSAYTLDFVLDGRRHEYSFEVDARGIKRERLRDVPSSRWRTLVDRAREGASASTKMHPSLKTMADVTDRELILSRALLLDHPQLAPIAEGMIRGFDIVLVKASHRAQRLAELTESLAEGRVEFADLQALLALADVGVTEVGVEEEKVPEQFLRLLRGVNTENAEEPAEGRETSSDRGELDEDELELVARHLTFVHRGAAASTPPFSIDEESDGTIAWLAVAVPALEALRRGSVLAVDEIDASIHPHLLDLLLGAFSDPSVNTWGAQLVFSSHESYVLSPMSQTRLEPEQVWFTDKDRDGAASLTCLADFPRHPDANVAKRYLEGRYGGTPRLSPSLLAALVQSR